VFRPVPSKVDWAGCPYPTLFVIFTAWGSKDSMGNEFRTVHLVLPKRVHVISPMILNPFRGISPKEVIPTPEVDKFFFFFRTQRSEHLLGVSDHNPDSFGEQGCHFNRRRSRFTLLD
jgi:hypothetical protein